MVRKTADNYQNYEEYLCVYLSRNTLVGKQSDLERNMTSLLQGVK